jgi:endonuclease/exonuclease/phosphatase family metal-dependent hydrolase
MRKLLSLISLFLLLQISTAEETNKDLTNAKLLTYNVLADPVHPETRLPAIFDILEKSDADIIALQEVAPWFLIELEKQEWLKKYHGTKAEGKLIAPRGLLILSKSPIQKVTAELLTTRQHRALLVVETEIKNIKVTVATCHLESPLEASRTRAIQIDEFFKILDKAEHSVFLGDFNFGDGEEPETSMLIPKFVDSWLLTNGKEVGYTWNMEKNEMAKSGSFSNEKSRRLDRIFIKSTHLTPTKIEIIGDQEIEKNQGLYPSDHFGLLGTVKVSK